MYLNIINNIKYGDKRKSKNSSFSKNDEKKLEYLEETEINNKDDNNSYYSIFYGDLTKNWINLKP